MSDSIDNPFVARLCTAMSSREPEMAAAAAAREPERRLAALAERAASAAPVPVTVDTGTGTGTVEKFADNRQFDAVVCSLVLCSVGDPE